MKNVSFNCKPNHFNTSGRCGLSLKGPHLTAQSGELAEGDDQIVENITEAIVSRYHCTFPVQTEKNMSIDLKPYKT